jgi:acyl-CoA synthetase (AMP-forming)/AMP-acid ligase II
MFRAQVAALAELYTMRAGDVDLACFAPFALFGPALGLSTVLPDIDFSAPAKADPERIVSAVRAHGAVQTFGSPAIWKRVASWAREHDASMPTLRRLMIAGAPVHPALIEACLALLPPDGDVFTPYGATEALPIASASGREILALHRGATESGSGNCIGTLAPFVEARVMRVTDAAVPRWSDDLAVRPGESGELVVAGPQVTREYVLEPEHTARAKIDDGGRVWHRMGDVVRVDDAGRLWFRGRKSHRLETRAGPLDPVGVENVFNTHPNVGRSALVGVGARGEELPVLVVELAGGAKPSEALSQSILELHSRCPDARRVERVLYRSSLPVDVRHNAKIDRGALKLWAERELA